MSGFSKRIYGFRKFFDDATGLGIKIPKLLSTLAGGNVDPAFREKVMLAVTAVNDCRYCHNVHTKLARLHAVSQDEIDQVISCQQDDEIAPEHRFAVAFACHYAKTEKNPDMEMTEKLKEEYGEETAEQILLFLDTIYFANLTGNTFDAFLSRLRGQKAEDSSLLFELPFALMIWPILLPQSIYLNLKGAD